MARQRQFGDAPEQLRLLRDGKRAGLVEPAVWKRDRRISGSEQVGLRTQGACRDAAGLELGMFDGLLWIALAMLMALDWPESSLAIIRLLTGAAALKRIVSG